MTGILSVSAYELCAIGVGDSTALSERAPPIVPGDDHAATVCTPRAAHVPHDRSVASCCVGEGSQSLFLQAVALSGCIIAYS